jgi:hypothetical protein
MNTYQMPKWFKLENYMAFNELSDFNLRMEFLKRIKADSEFNSNDNNSFLNQIEVGQPISRPLSIDIPSMSDYLESKKYRVATTDEEQEIYDEILREELAFQSRWRYRSISPFLMDDLTIAENVFDISFSKNLQANSKSEVQTHVKEWPMSWLIARSKNSGALRGKITINLDAENFTDQEILIDLEKYLKELREMIKIPEPKIIKARNGDYIKAKEYRVFAFFDLMYWARLNNIQIKKSVLAISVFPAGEKSIVEFNDTISTYMKNIFSLKYRH